MQEHVEFFKMYDPLKKQFTSMHQRFKTIERAAKEFKYYQERVSRGIRLDTADLIKRQIIVRINKDNEVLESYCSEYDTARAANIAYFEHQLMIKGHEGSCPECTGRAWPLMPPMTETIKK